MPVILLFKFSLGFPSASVADEDDCSIGCKNQNSN